MKEIALVLALILPGGLIWMLGAGLIHRWVDRKFGAAWERSEYTVWGWSKRAWELAGWLWPLLPFVLPLSVCSRMLWWVYYKAAG